MWSVFIGIGLGALLFYMLKKLVGFVTSDKDRLVISVLVTIGKMALTLAVLFLVTKYGSIDAMIWCAGGVAGALIVLSVAKSVAFSKKEKAAARQRGES